MFECAVNVEPSQCPRVVPVAKDLGTSFLDLGQYQFPITVDSPVDAVHSLNGRRKGYVVEKGRRVRNGFESGGRRIESTHRQVEEGFLIRKSGKFELIDSPHELLGIEVGRAGQGQNLSVGDVHHHRCGPLGGIEGRPGFPLRQRQFPLLILDQIGEFNPLQQGVLHHPLETFVNSQVDGRSRGRWNLSPLLCDPPGSIDPIDTFAGYPLQPLVIEALHSQLADSNVGIQKGSLLQVLVGRVTQMSYHVGHRATRQIDPLRIVLHHHARKGTQLFLQLVGGHRINHRQRKPLVDSRLVIKSSYPLGRYVQARSQTRNRLLFL